MICPHCHHDLSDDEVRQLMAEFGKRHVPSPKAMTSAANGRKGGRPVTYFQNVYDLIPSAIEIYQNKLAARNERLVFEIELIEETNPIENGFSLRCGGVTRQCRWNRNSHLVEVFDGAHQTGGFNTINNSAQTAANRLVQDIHIAKLESMPANFSDVHAWAEKNIRGIT